ncbi:MAG TPA: hypothetical protein VFE30_02105 [Anaeromyxobacteraceae bacterium]|jgi:hypothetical protein|nr:hypothetical protein [Anaeromyxobacteraceae bacterium]
MLFRRVLLTALACAAASPAAAFDVGGAISGGYWRSDSWSGGVHDSAPAFDYGGSIGVSGTPIRRDILFMTAGADYRQTHSYYSTGNSQNGNFTYNGNASLFTGFPLTLNLSAARTRADFTTDAGGATTGTTVMTSQTASASYTVSGLPGVNAQFSRSDSDNSGFGGQHHTYGFDALAASANQSIGPHHYSLSYDTSWNRGDLAENNYRFHHLDFQEGTQLSRDLDFTVSDNYLLRDPTLGSPVNPRIDDNAFITAVRWRPNSVVNTSTSYVYHHSLITAVATPDRESSNQGLFSTADYKYSRRLSFSATAGFNRGEERLAGNSVKSTGEQVSGGATWNSMLGPWQYSTGGQLSIGLLHSSTSGTDGAYGASGSVGFSRGWNRFSASLSYNGAYASNLSARAGSTFTHGLSGSSEADLGRGFLLTSTLALNSSRQDDPLLGASFSRTATLSSTIRYRRYAVSLHAGLADGLAGRTQGGISDGLFIPVAYNTHSAFASASSSVQLARTLTLSGILHYVSATTPEQPTSHEAGVGLNLTYNVGSFAFTGEERYSTGGVSGLTQSGNYLVFRVTRSFGTSF